MEGNRGISSGHPNGKKCHKQIAKKIQGGEDLEILVQEVCKQPRPGPGHVQRQQIVTHTMSNADSELGFDREPQGQEETHPGNMEIGVDMVRTKCPLTGLSISRPPPFLAHALTSKK